MVAQSATIIALCAIMVAVSFKGQRATIIALLTKQSWLLCALGREGQRATIIAPCPCRVGNHGWYVLSFPKHIPTIFALCSCKVSNHVFFCKANKTLESCKVCLLCFFSFFFQDEKESNKNKAEKLL